MLIVRYVLAPVISTDVAFILPEQKKVDAAGALSYREFSPPSASDYASIGDDNVFHPDRIIPPEKKGEPELPRPDFVLYGTMVSDEQQVAYLEDLKAPRTTPGRGKRQIALKKGDTLSGFTLKEVGPDKIFMTRGEEYLFVHVIDKRKSKMRDSAQPAEPQQPVGADAPRRSVPIQKAQQAAQAESTPSKEKPVSIPPPRSNLESVVYDHFNIGK